MAAIHTMLTEYEHEPVPGLPQELPDGEEMLWQGSPRWQSPAVHVFHARKVAVYFGLLALWRVASGLHDGQAFAEYANSLAMLLVVGTAGVGMLTLLAWLNGRATIYTITNRRLVLRIGVALPMMVNLPFRVVDSAALRTFRDASGDIPLTLDAATRVGYLNLWPHVRPWQIKRPQPALRAVPDAAGVARILSAALAGTAGGSATHSIDAVPTVPANAASSGPLVHAA